MSENAPDPDSIDVTAEYVLQLNTYLKKNLKASLSGLKVYKAALVDNPNLLTYFASDDDRKAFLGTLVMPYRNKLTRKYKKFLETFDSDWKSEDFHLKRKFEKTIDYVNELNRQLIQNFNISYENLEEYKNSDILSDFITNDERWKNLENLKQPFLQAVHERFIELVDTFNKWWIKKLGNKKPSRLAIAEEDESFIDGFKEIDKTLLNFGCPVDINFENFYQNTYRTEVLKNPSAIKGEIFISLANEYTNFLIKRNLDDTCKYFIKNNINTQIEHIAKTIDSHGDSKNRSKSAHSIKSPNRGREFHTEPLAIDLSNINKLYYKRITTPSQFSLPCNTITYKNQNLVKEDYGGSGECFFKAIGALFQKFGVKKTDETVRKEFCDFTAKKIVEMLKLNEFTTVINKFDAIFQGPAIDQNDTFDRRVISTFVKNFHTTYPHHLTTEEIVEFVYNNDLTRVAEALVHPTRFTRTNSGHESWANENTIFAAGNYMTSVLHNTPVTGLVILNCVTSPQVLFLPEFTESQTTDDFGRIIHFRNITRPETQNKLLIVRVNGNHYVVGSHPTNNQNIKQDRYLFDVLQNSWSLEKNDFVKEYEISW